MTMVTTYKLSFSPFLWSLFSFGRHDEKLVSTVSVGIYEDDSGKKVDRKYRPRAQFGIRMIIVKCERKLKKSSWNQVKCIMISV